MSPDGCWYESIRGMKENSYSFVGDPIISLDVRIVDTVPNAECKLYELEMPKSVDKRVIPPNIKYI